jgi:PAS domain S-box-containing protein
LVDGDPAHLAALANLLEQSGIGVTAAHGGDEALDLAERARPSVILLQLLPGLDGLETCRRLKARETTREIPIIFQTWSAETATRIAAFAAGGADCITLPAPAEEVLARVRTQLELVRLRRQLEQAGEALQKSEKRFATVFDTCPIPAAISELDDGRVLDINRAFSGPLGYTRDEFVGHTTMELGIWADPEVRRRVTESLRAGHAVRGQEAFLRSKDGRLLNAQFSAGLLERDEGPCLLTMAADVTDLKQAEETLRRSERTFAKLFRANPVALSISRMEDGRFIDVNDAHVRMMGHSREETIGHTPTELGYWVDLKDMEPLRRQREANGFVHNQEVRFRAKDGHLLTVMFSMESVELEGELCRLCLLSDITDQKQAVETLRKSEQRFATIFRANPVAISLIRQSDDRLIDLNEAHVRLFGHTREEAIGHTVLELGYWVDLSDADSMQQQRETGGGIRNREVRFRAKDGRLLTVLCTVDLVELEGEMCRLCLFSDITESKRVEEELQAWMHRYELIVAASGQVAYEYSVPTGAITWGSSIESVLGYTADEIAGGVAQWEDLIHPDDRASTLASFDATLKGCTYWDAQYRMRHKRGDYVWVRDRGFFLPNADGKALRQLGMLEDINEKKKAEEELRYRNTLLSTQQEASIDGILVVDANGRILSFNRRFVELWGIPEEVMESGRDDLALQSVMDKLSDPGGFRSKVADAYAHPEGTLRDEVVLADGRVFDRYSAPVTGADGTDYGRVWHFSDITGRKCAEEILRKSEQRFAAVFRANPVAIAIVRMSDDRIVDVNNAFIKLFGHSREEAIGRTTLEVGYWAEPAEMGSVQQQREAEGFVHNRETRFRAKDGQLLTVLFTVELIELAGELCQLCLFSDITERKREEEERARLETQLQQAQKLESIGRLAGGVAHDFNNLLTVINGYSELLLKGLGRGDPRRSEVDQIRQAGESAAALTQQLLAFSRRQIIQPKPLNLNEVVATTERMLRRLIGEDIELRTALDPYLGTTMADPGQIDQILMNLAVNARDAMPTGGQLSIETTNVTVDSRYEAGHAEAAPGLYILLAVSDTGTGMDAETRRHIFEPFFTTKAKGQGTGLGLATVYGIVKQSGGWLSVYSEPGKGTAFKIYFPRTTVTGSGTEYHEAAASSLSGTETILIVEDQDEVRGLAVAALERHGYRLLEASDGAAALELLAREAGPVAAMVTDVVLPGMNGSELAQRVAELRPEIKIIYTSGYTEDAIVTRGVLAQGVEFLPKPYTATALAARIRRLLG